MSLGSSQILSPPLPHAQTIPARVVHEGDAEVAWPAVLLTIPYVLSEPRLPESPDGSTHPCQRRRQGEGQLRQVLARRVVAGVGACANVDHGMLPHLLELRVVPAATEVVPRIVVGRVGHPLRAYLPILRLGEVDEDLLPVGFVVVRTEEPAPPVVERVEQPVLQYDPTVLAQYASVVAVLFLFGHYALVGHRSRGGRFPRHPATGKERYRVKGVDEAGEIPYRGKPAPPGPESLLRF